MQPRLALGAPLLPSPRRADRSIFRLAAVVATLGLALVGCSADPAGATDENPPASEFTPAANGERTPTRGAVESSESPAAASDAGVGANTDAGAPSSPAKALEGAERTWTWIPVEGARCADGSPTGIGYSPSSTNRNVVVYLQGGGACWDDGTCNQLKLASYVDGFSEVDFQQDIGKWSQKTPLDRTLPDNPFRDDTLIYIPYCTGDIHGGLRDAVHGGKTYHHVGFTNVGLAIARMVATFSAPTRLVVTGTSAGGFGAAYNFWRFRDAFPRAKAYLIDDSGPPIPPPFAPKNVTDTWRSVWGLDATLPKDCEGCQSRFDALFDHYALKYPDARYALISYTTDPIIAIFYSVPLWNYPAALDTLAETALAKRPNFQYFYATGLDHVLLKTYTTVETKGIKLTAWVNAMVGDDASWASIRP